MSKKAIRERLKKYGLYVYQLANYLGIDRQTYYSWGYVDFRGHKQQIKNGIKSLIRSKGSVIHDD